MPLRLLPVSTVLLILLTADARSSQVFPSFPHEGDVGPDMILFLNGEKEVHRLAPYPKAQHLLPEPVTDAQKLLNLTGSSALFGRTELSGVIAAILKRADQVVFPQVRDLDRTNHSVDAQFRVQNDRRVSRPAADRPEPVALPLPATGWLLTSAVLATMLLKEKRARIRRRIRQPLRYRTV